MIPETGIPVHYENKLVGTIHRGEFWQTRRPNNFLKWGIAFDAGVLAEVERLGANRVRIKNAETGTIYTASLAVIREYGRSVNYGYGEQIAVSFAYWQVTIPRSAEPSKQPQRPAQPEAAQLALFGGAI
jgi:hypothetical protein